MLDLSPPPRPPVAMRQGWIAQYYPWLAASFCLACLSVYVVHTVIQARIEAVKAQIEALEQTLPAKTVSVEAQARRLLTRVHRQQVRPHDLLSVLARPHPYLLFLTGLAIEKNTATIHGRAASSRDVLAYANTFLPKQGYAQVTVVEVTRLALTTWLRFTLQIHLSEE